MSNFTRGDWKVVDVRKLGSYAERTGAHYAIDGEDFRPALILGDGTINRGLALANAQLIAAAPHMYEAHGLNADDADAAVDALLVADPVEARRLLDLMRERSLEALALAGGDKEPTP